MKRAFYLALLSVVFFATGVVISWVARYQSWAVPVVIALYITGMVVLVTAVITAITAKGR